MEHVSPKLPPRSIDRAKGIQWSWERNEQSERGRAENEEDEQELQMPKGIISYKRWMQEAGRSRKDHLL